MNVELLQENAEKIKKYGLDDNLKQIATAASQEARDRLRLLFPYATIFDANASLENILGLTDGHIEGLSILDLGCGDGTSFAPVLSEALGLLGANVTGVDLDELSFADKVHFSYVQYNMVMPMHEVPGLLKEKDIIIAKHLLHHGLKATRERYDLVSSREGDYGEWRRYKKLLSWVARENNRASLYIIDEPEIKTFAEEFHLDVMSAKTLQQQEIASVVQEVLLKDHFSSLYALGKHYSWR
jgi:SAM-dependent methyltransferase